MSDSDRHINFQLMRDHILRLQDEEQPRAGKKYWRSLDELADTPVFREFVAREFPQQAESWNDPFERRTFLKLMGASLALAGLSGCVYQPPEKIVPYVKQPEEILPGKPLFFATAAPMFGAATPILVRSNEGRPTKIEGNPDHPNNRPLDFPAEDPYRDPRGSSTTDIFTQASILGLYDPDRSQTLTYREDIRPWTAFVGAMQEVVNEQRPKQGAGIRFLTETITSPSLGAQMNDLLTAFPQAKWHQWEPANQDNPRGGAMMAFGQPVHITYKFDVAQRVLSLDADFLSGQPGSLRYAREFMGRRRISENNRDMNRLYVIETTPTNTGAMADHTWEVKPSEFEGLVRTIASGGSANAYPWIGALLRDLQQHKGASIVIAGDNQPPIIHALAHSMNDALGNVGKTVFYSDPLAVKSVDQRTSLQELLNDIDAGRVDLLVIIGGNPVHTTPPDLKLDFNRVNNKVKVRVHLSEYKDETTEICHWHVPAAHYLESWGDARSYDGTVTIIQPLIEPLYEGKTPYELLAVFTDQYDRRPYDVVRAYWQQQQSRIASANGQNAATQQSPAAQPGARAVANQSAQPAQGATTTQASQATAQTTPQSQTREQLSDFETWWRQSVHDGFIPNTALQTKTVSVNNSFISQPPAAQTAPGGFELVIRTDPSIYDGRFANNGWLQELPKPLTKVTWDNVALLSPNSAKQITGISDNGGAVKGREHYVPVLEITNQHGQKVLAPLWILPGQPDGVVTIHLGYGRRRAGRVGGTEASPVGFDAYALRNSFEPWFSSGIQIRATGEQHVLATTQLHFTLEDPNFSGEPRDVIRSQTVEEFLGGEEYNENHDYPSLYHDYHYDNQSENAPNYAWGMAIDLNNCIGCNACTIACQAENNIPVVGKKEVIRSREMHWIRVDTYYKGFDPNHPEATNFMPVPCMHCENAPCEPVCPVHATVHSAEGLNDMVYNRCVGTKYCSNNCPYKVRRFNFFLYQDWNTPTYQLMRNPEVSVRSRGVMEKCTYCVQRIQNAKIQAELEDRKVRDGEIITSCQAACPTEAIIFGDVNDPSSRVNRLKNDKRDYSLLGELNTRPRTTYQSQLKNPNLEISQNRG
ncbi:MAG TPA: TAT-variant-translocated molybdopterin oxidoreductase [Pyrinomonadaceae bacterium]|nr:TAT-variant-translocated molybdopterin oxidoreductase [Pyrinomonadaceae bacterium]